MTATAKPTLSVVTKSSRSELSLSSELRPLIPEGNYHLKLLKDNTQYMFGGWKLCLRFSVIDFGEYQGTELVRYYNLMKNSGKFEVPLNGDFMIDYFTVLPGRVRRRDRMSLDPLYDKITYAHVSTVKTNNLGKQYPESIWYSKVGKLICLKEDLIP